MQVKKIYVSDSPNVLVLVIWFFVNDFSQACYCKLQRFKWKPVITLLSTKYFTAEIKLHRSLCHSVGIDSGKLADGSVVQKEQKIYIYYIKFKIQI